MISDLNPNTPTVANMNLYAPEMRDIKEQVKASLPNNTEGTVLTLIKGVKDDDGIYQLNKNLPERLESQFILQLDSPASGRNQCKQPTGLSDVYVTGDFDSYKVYPMVVTDNLADLEVAQFFRQEVAHYTNQIVPFGVWPTNERPDYSEYQEIRMNAAQSLMLDTDVDITTPRVTTMITNIASALLRFNDTETKFKVRPNLTDGTIDYIRASVSNGAKFGYWKMFFDGTQYYLSARDEVNTI